MAELWFVTRNWADLTNVAVKEFTVRGGLKQIYRLVKDALILFLLTINAKVRILQPYGCPVSQVH